MKSNRFESQPTMRRILMVALSVVAFTLQAQPPIRDCDQECQDELAMARAATAKYHDVNVALAEGYVPVSPCVALPNGAAMGFHYAKFPLMNAVVDPAQPEALLYLPNADGELKLIGLEFIVPAAAVSSAPTVLGQTMQGPFSRGGPPSYELHVWAWKHNPDGLFAPFNPKLRCP